MSEDQKSAEKIQQLQGALNEAISERSHSVEEILDTLEELVGDASALFGFDALGPQLVGQDKTVQSRPTKKQKASPVAEIAQPAVEPWQAASLGADFSENEQKVLDELALRYPKFTTAQQLVRSGALEIASLASPTITRLRKKSVPIESAKQARENDPSIRQTTSGWRLIKD